jgi:hypothetical protein
LQQKLGELARHTAWWRDKWYSWAHSDDWHKNSYAGHVHERANLLFVSSLEKLQAVATTVERVEVSLVPVFLFDGGAGDVKYTVTEIVKKGYSTSSQDSSRSTTVASQASGSVSKLFMSASAELNVQVDQYFTSLAQQSFAVEEVSKTFDITLSQPLYVYVSKTVVFTEDGNAHTYQSDALIQTSEKLKKLSFSIRAEDVGRRLSEQASNGMVAI